MYLATLIKHPHVNSDKLFITVYKIYYLIQSRNMTCVDPTRSTDQRDSLLNGRKNVKIKCGLIFEFWKIRPKGGTVLPWSRHLLLFLFYKEKTK